ncbi:hypothetical protein AWC38_SpisGene22270 [Stylophora pistillata]|uniref:SAP domain-containing protein n=1 Tax=Stylophora pistillata TaxID=50429 RepID=A0A2B4RBM8_STYPI|nr:hypothetical protein AWC38_SpisGene22270 [Stylophora pistillata]
MLAEYTSSLIPGIKQADKDGKFLHDRILDPLGPMAFIYEHLNEILSACKEHGTVLLSSDQLQGLFNASAHGLSLLENSSALHAKERRSTVLKKIKKCLFGSGFDERLKRQMLPRKVGECSACESPQGVYGQTGRRSSTNCLELLADAFAVKVFARNKIQMKIRLLVDNVSANHYVNKMGAQLPKFISWRPDPEAEAFDAFSQDWSKDNETEALKSFTNITNLTPVQTSLWLHESGVLGASPDGLVGDDSVSEWHQVFTSPEDMEEAFNNHFTSIGQTLACELPTVDIDPLDYVKPPDRVYSFERINVEEVVNLVKVNTPNHMRNKMAVKYSSDFEIEDELSQKSVEQLRGLLKGKGLPTTGKKKVLVQRLVDNYYESKNSVKLEPSKESFEDMNFTKFSNELTPAANAKQQQEIASIRLKAKLPWIDNGDLPNVQKFTYLHSVLTGNALQAIQGFEVTGANYQPAVECIKHTYGRKRVVISSLVKSVVQMDAKYVVTAPSLRDLYDTLKNRTRALEALGEIPKSHVCILLPIFEAAKCFEATTYAKQLMKTARRNQQQVNFAGKQKVEKETVKLSEAPCYWCSGNHR